MTFSPTEEQSAIIQAAGQSSASLMISAYAGTAKTTTIELLAKHLSSPYILALAFNVKIKEELVKRLPPTITVKTLNGLGHSAWAKATGKKLQLETGKVGKMIGPMAKANNIALDKKAWAEVKDLVEAARTAGLVPNFFSHVRSHIPDEKASWEDLCEANDIPFSPAIADLARGVLIESIKQAYNGIIDFSDQIYMSVCFGGVFQKYHTIIVDEAQDLSLMNHLMLQKSLPSRLIICGDPKQSLYAFRGAATNSMEKIRALRPDWIDLPLTITFRCPKTIVARQQAHAPGYRAADTAPAGQVIDWQEESALPQKSPSPSWGVADIFTTLGLPDKSALLPKSLSILCRNNAPLISLAFKLIRRNLGISFLGRDLGKGLTLLIKKISPQETTPIEKVIEGLAGWKDREISILSANGNESGKEKIYDKYESIMAVVQSTSSVNQKELCSAIDALFSKENGLVELATAHRAKGLEWEHVVHLDPWRIPSKWAKSQEALLQESNAQYVLETRAKRTLFLANLEHFK